MESSDNTPPDTLSVAILAGEESGDILGSGLMRELKAVFPRIQFSGVGGRRMSAEGLQSQFPMERLSVMGLVEVLKRYRELSRRRKQLINDWLENPPHLFIGIDAPDFNLEIERRLRSVAVPTVHYVSPSVWAWRQKRIKTIESAVDLMLCFLPFESQFYERTRVQARFIGHPLASQLPLVQNREPILSQWGLDPERPVIALMPGSRRSELEQLSGIFIDTASWLATQRPGIQFILPVANSLGRKWVEERLALSGQDLNIRVVEQQTHQALTACDAVLIASGTATLEALLCGKPMVVAYRMARLTYAIISRMLKTSFISLPNLLAGSALVPEVLQEQVNPQTLGPLVLKALEDQPYRDWLKSRFEELSQPLRTDADYQACVAVTELLNKRYGDRFTRDG